jgi:uncharacterized membrane protein
MSLSLEALPLIIIFFLPGFFVYYARQYLNPAITADLDNFQFALLSLGYSTIISVFEALLFAMGLSWLGIDIASLVQSPIPIIAQYPIWTLIFLSVWIIVALIIASLIGAKDPYLWFLSKLNRQVRRSDTDSWFNLLELIRRQTGEDTTAVVTVHMKNGSLFTGYVLEFQALPNDDGNRNFTLAKVYSMPGKDSNKFLKENYLGDNSFVMLHTRDIDALEVVLDNT